MCRTVSKFKTKNLLQMSLTKGCVELLENMKLKLLRIVSHKSLYRTMSKYETETSYNCLSQKAVSNCEKIETQISFICLSKKALSNCEKI